MPTGLIRVIPQEQKIIVTERAVKDKNILNPM